VPDIVYSLGTSTRTIQEFVSLCRTFEIEVVADVRRFPVSKFDHFNKDNFASELQRAGVEYFYLGDVLGGYRDGGYQEHAQTSEFGKGIEKLEEIALKRRTAFVCAERFPWRCHRKFIALRLAEDGWRVIHILDEENTWESKKRPTNLSLDI
jgi:uncharacterized protein (DUF488 family)